MRVGVGVSRLAQICDTPPTEKGSSKLLLIVKACTCTGRIFQVGLWAHNGSCKGERPNTDFSFISEDYRHSV